MLLRDYAPTVGFGTSGVRALVEDLTPDVVAAYARAFVKALRSQDQTVEGCVVGWDLRPSSPAIAAAVCAGLEAEGVTPEIAGPCPTPALGLRSLETGRPGVAVTGSHIPFDRNGVKFFTPRGEITKADERAIMRLKSHDLVIETVALTAAVERWMAAQAEIDTSTMTAYRARFTTAFPADAFSGMRIGVYQHSAVGRDFLTGLLGDLGAEVFPLGRSDSFVPIDTEVVLPRDEAMAAAWAAQHRLDVVVSTDGDGDRPWICDERGLFLRGDVLGVIAARRLGAERVATPVSSNTALEKCGAFKKTARTRIGSPFVIEGMELLARDATGCVVGYEANGGFLTQTAAQLNGSTLSPLPTRDSMLPILLALTVAKESGAPLSTLAQSLPPRRTASGSIKGILTIDSTLFVSELNLEPKLLAEFLAFTGSAPASVNSVDGLRVTLESGDIVHLRPSGNAPEFRCYVESDTQLKADALLSAALEAIGGRFTIHEF
jgi:phosphomannomutase